MSALFRWPPSISFHVSLPCDVFTFVSQVRCLHCWCPPFSAGHAAFLFICLPGDFFTLVSQIQRLHCWCPPFSAGQAAFLFVCLPVSQVISLLLFPRFGACTAGVRPFPLAMQYAAFLFICLQGLPLVVFSLFGGHVAFLFICLPGLSVVVSALFRWRSNFSFHSPNSSLLGVLNSFLTRVRPFCHCCCPPFSAGDAAIHLSPSFRACTAGVRPFPLATQHFFSCLSPM